MVQPSKSPPPVTYIDLTTEVPKRRKLARRWFTIGWFLAAICFYTIGKTDLDVWVLVGAAVISIICHWIIDRQSQKL